MSKKTKIVLLILSVSFVLLYAVFNFIFFTNNRLFSESNYQLGVMIISFGMVAAFVSLYYILAFIINIFTGSGGVMIVFILLFTGTGILMIITGFNEIRHGIKTRNYIETTGVIRKSEVVSSTTTQRTYQTTAGNRQYGNMNSSYKSTVYFYGVEYLYTVNSVDYIGTRYDVSNSSLQREKAIALAESIQVGSVVPVYYDPEDQQSSVLKKGVASYFNLPMIIGLIFTIFSLFFLVLAIVFRDKKK